MEFDAQPEPRIEYTAKLDSAIIKRIPRVKSEAGTGRGIGNQSESAKVRAKAGARVNIRGEEVRGEVGSLINSLMPSAIG